MRTLALVLCVLWAGCGGATATAGTTVAVVDMQRALRECQEGRTASAQLRQLYASRQADLDRRQEQIRTTQAGLTAAQSQGQNVDARMAVLQQDVMTLQGEFQSFQQQLNEAEQRATGQILERLKASLRALAQRRSIDVVLDSEGVIASGPRVVDVTTDLIHAYDTHPAPAPAPAH